MMKERPILFNSEMVDAILKGRKTQTRRVVRVNRDWHTLRIQGPSADWLGHKTERTNHGHNCPYGKPGDQLWVRETLKANSVTSSVRYVSDGNLKEVPLCWRGWVFDKWKKSTVTPATIPSIHMPRWASRIQLEITDIRVERVQEISSTDAKAEGFWPSELNGLEYYGGQIFGNSEKAFRACWDSINLQRGFGWAKNPWVWVVEFKVV